MIKKNYACIILIFFTFFCFMQVDAGNTSTNKKRQSTEMFPPAKEGNIQHIIHLKPQKNEDDFTVELSVGKHMMVDCNKHFFAGSITEQNLDGWGYPYYVAETNGEVAGTRMLCPDGKKHADFVSIQALKIRYNSKLPIVIYVPRGFEVQYRIWKAGKYMTVQTK